MEPSPTDKNTKRTIEPISSNLQETSIHTVKTNPNDTYPRAASDLSDFSNQQKRPLSDDQHQELGRTLPTRGGDTEKTKKTVRRIAVVLGALAVVGLASTAVSLLYNGFLPFLFVDITLDIALLWSAYGLYRFREFARMLSYAIVGVMLITSTFAVIAGFFSPLTDMPTSEQLLLLLYIAIAAFSAWAFAYLGRSDVRRACS